jgi:pimeloyl-ACP methyl ester carboxylesterase
VYCDVAELFGNTEAIGIWDRFYSRLVRAGLSHRASLVGFSRGGLYVYLWALAYPDRVTCVYADAPSLDFKSWPGGKGIGGGNKELWELFKKEFDLGSEAGALAWKGNPLDRAGEIARGGYPMLHVIGDADMTVPPGENTDPFEQKVLAAGGRITVIRKPGVGHHPHSLIDPAPIVEFILKATAEQR